MQVMIAALFFFQSCSNDPYDTGDGSLSYMRADFAEVATDGSSEAASATTDEGKSLRFQSAKKVDWMTVKDSLYRALLYYDTNEDAATATVRPIAISQVLVPNVMKAVKSKIYPTDPVTFSSAWESPSGRYINLDISIKTGKKDGKVEAQGLGFVYNGTTTGADGTKVHSITMIHDQGNAPQYYSVQTYVSIPLYRLPFKTGSGDVMEIKVNTYKGVISRQFQI